MKHVKSIALALLVVIAGIACKKDSTDSEFSVHGKWSGKIGNNADVPTGQFALNIKSGGTIERLNSSGSAVGTGTWSLTGNNFTATYTMTSSGTVVNINGTLDKGQSKLAGNWNNSSEQGTFTTTKSN